MSDGTSVGSRLGAEGECVAEQGVPPEGSERLGPG